MITRQSRVQPWTFSRRYRRWGCLVAAVSLIAIAVGGLGLLIWVVRPRPPIHAIHLIGHDVDGLAVLELHRASPRIQRFVETLLRPYSYEVQSRPEDLGREISQLLDVMTYRRAYGLWRYDPTGQREQWAWVIPLKRLGDPLKVLVREMAGREAPHGLAVETSGGVLLVFGKNKGPYCAIAQRAAVVAGDRPWLETVLARIENPVPKTPRAVRLYENLPTANKHCLARAFVLATPPRWQGWTRFPDNLPASLRFLAEMRRRIEAGGIPPGEVESLAFTATVQPRQQIRCELVIACRDTSASTALARCLAAQWRAIQNQMKEFDLTADEVIATVGASVEFGWTTPRLEQMLGLAPVEVPASP
ncbi:MAG: hypothetical protein N3D11_13570 [Candidatus Sumerlaeia bacterium]|nr:hypothetical protein [Candidatus Sumerlaeia bacterium]